MAVRSDRLAASSSVASINTWQVLGTVPAGETWLWKSVSVTNGGAAATDVQFRVPGVASLLRITVAAAAVEYRDLWHVLEPGAVLEWRSTTQTSTACYLSGARLLGSAN